MGVSKSVPGLRGARGTLLLKNTSIVQLYRSGHGGHKLSKCEFWEGGHADFTTKARQLFNYWSGRRGAQIGEMRVWRGWAHFFTKKHGNYSKMPPPTLPNTAVIEQNQKNQKNKGGETTGAMPGEAQGSSGAPGEAQGSPWVSLGFPWGVMWDPGLALGGPWTSWRGPVESCGGQGPGRRSLGVLGKSSGGPWRT